MQKGKIRSLFNIQELIGEKNFHIREEAVRLALFCSSFFSIYTLSTDLLIKLRRVNDSFNSYISGGLSGLSLLFYFKHSRRTISLYIMARLLQCVYNSLKDKGKLDSIKPYLKHGDSLLFILSSAQVMFAYVMYPKTLPPSYNKFIIETGPINRTIIEAVRRNNNNLPIDVRGISNYCSKFNTNFKLNTPYPNIIGCNMLHPKYESCTKAQMTCFTDVIRKVFPLYASITFLPLIIFRLKKLIKDPVMSVGKSLLSTIQSTIFLSTFVSTYLVSTCYSRRILSKDNRYLYFLYGIFCSTSILLEKKSRRSELALYVFPRAIDSLYNIMLSKSNFSIPHGDLILFMLSMSGIMYYYTNERNTVSPLLTSLMNYLNDDNAKVDSK